MLKTKGRRYSISVPRGIYDRLRAVVAPGSLAGLVDELIASTLDDPETSAGVVARCRQAGAQS
jgi:hypothetical protein